MTHQQMFLTKANLDALPPLYSNEDLGEDAVVQVKFFCPWNQWTWYATEFDADRGLFFGLVVGMETELGYFDRNTLEAVKGPGGLYIERDYHFKPCTIAEARKLQ